MKNTKKLILIIVLALVSLYIDLPQSFTLLNKTFERPGINWSLGTYNFTRDLNIREGLDLAGGSHIVLSADMSAIKQEDRDRALESLRSIIERRVNFFGVSEPTIQTAKVGNDYRIIVELAGIKETSSALNLIGQTAKLTFREEATPSADTATLAAILYQNFQTETELSGTDLARATADFDQNTGEPIVNLEFTTDGAKKFEDITKRNLNKQVAIFLDEQLLMAPTVQSVISGGKALISGQFTPAQTKELSALLNSGALPAPVKVIEERTVGATLGQDSVDKSLIAGAIGLGIVAVFMIANYGLLGVVADIALLIYVLVSLAVFKLIPVTLTLAGITGFILSIGMAVDANILIFERMKEEIHWGKQKFQAVELGFARAFPSIRDSNANSLIICAILYWFGTGAIRGFAITLAIGIAVSLFTAITVTRTLLRLLIK
ncbi:protein-export membrane protein SecD [Candidatus Gottesmanbacteria bacterium RIFCSPHIGHO2_01_FULL_42_12]|uniref:Protein translocase subunit SecD n=1 Tax=Candidatus Gottesmanbacteria bacterium RIFCSPHIGHO2_01_FULL_42_12 TaxID=1798377 RepID=A0A1F5Z1D4_9BACT|nr:MAG: protein-export membrane protein SecD [Candidatus Gottesmanbacteria bacterium RIFCSPHIGHO2_01_FULL_42_12]